MKSNRKKISYNPFLLVPCQTFQSSSEHPFTVIFQSDALVVIDIHSHLSTTEVIGLLGGTYCVTQRVLKVINTLCLPLSLDNAHTLLDLLWFKIHIVYNILYPFTLGTSRSSM